MSNFSQRLDKLEPPPQHSEYLKEVNQRLARYAIETRTLVQTGKLPAIAWCEEQENMYQQWKKDPSFDAIEREVLEPKLQSEETDECLTTNAGARGSSNRPGTTTLNRLFIQEETETREQCEKRVASCQGGGWFSAMSKSARQQQDHENDDDDRS